MHIRGALSNVLETIRRVVKQFIATLIALLVIALVWLVLRRPNASTSIALRDATNAALAPQHDALSKETRREPVSDDAARSPVAEEGQHIATAHRDRLEVVSSTHLPLAFVEVESAPRLWQRRELVDRCCDLSHDHLPCGVRAPGHVASIVEHPSGVVVLEPDALLELDGDGLKQCLPSIVPFDGFVRDDNPYRAEWQARIAGVLTSGFVDMDHWAMASSLVRDGGSFTRNDEIQIQLEWRDHHVGYVEFFAHPGARGQYTLPCESTGELAPLDVDIEVSKTELRGEIDVAISRAQRGDEKAVVVKQPWGQVQLNPPTSMFMQSRLGLETNRVHWDELSLNESYRVRAHDLTTGALGCLVFVHDGGARTLTLHAGIVVHGRLVTPIGAPPLAGWCSWEGANPLQKDVVWANNMRDFKPAPDGQFELRGCGNLPWNDAGCTEFPTQIELSLQMIGFDEITRTFPVDGVGHCECGEIALAPRKASFVLAAGHGISGDSLSYLTVRVSTHPTWFLSNVRGTRLSDGSIALYPEIERDDKSGLFFSGWKGDGESIPASAVASETVEALVVDPVNAGGWPFRRAADGRYERVPERTYSVDTDCRAMPTQGGSWTLGWSWSGMAQRVSSLPQGAVGERRKLEFPAPESGVSFWWSSSSEPIEGENRAQVEGGEADLASGTLKLSVP